MRKTIEFFRRGDEFFSPDWPYRPCAVGFVPRLHRIYDIDIDIENGAKITIATKNPKKRGFKKIFLDHTRYAFVAKANRQNHTWYLWVKSIIDNFMILKFGAEYPVFWMRVEPLAPQSPQKTV